MFSISADRKRSVLNSLSYVLEIGEHGSYLERSERVFNEFYDVFSNFLRIWSGVLNSSFGLNFDFEGKSDVKKGRLFFEFLKSEWSEIVKRLENIDFDRMFLIGEDRVTCELVYVVFYLNSYALKRKCGVWKDTSRMVNHVILKLGNHKKMAGLLRHYLNSIFFSQEAYEEVLKRVRRVNSRAYALHVLECIESARNFAERDFPGISAYIPLIRIASNSRTVERVVRITRTDVKAEAHDLSGGVKYSIGVLFGEDGIRWGALTVLLILVNDFLNSFSSDGSNTLASKKLLEDMLNGNYRLNVDLFLYPEKRLFKSYINGKKVEDFELGLICKFIEDTSEYIFPVVENLTSRFISALEDMDKIPDCDTCYDYVVDAVRVRVRKKLATHLEYTCLITKPVNGYYLHFIVLEFESGRRYFCLACKAKNGKARPKDAFYMFDGVELRKIFEVILDRANRSFKLKPVSFSELKELAEKSKPGERMLARMKLKEAGIVV